MEGDLTPLPEFRITMKTGSSSKGCQFSYILRFYYEPHRESSCSIQPMVREF